MLYLRRIARRSKGWFWAAWYALLAPFHAIIFRIQMRGTGLSERYIWEAFTYLAGLDMDDPMWSGGLSIYGCGTYLELQDREQKFHATVQQVAPRRLSVQLWRPTKRPVTIDGFKGETHWWEVYRTGRRVDAEGLVQVYEVIRSLYGDGPQQKEERHAV